MKGWLVVNSFMESAKFSKLYALLLGAARSHGISLDLLRGDQLCGALGVDFPGRPLPDFVIFWDKDIHLAQALENAGARLFNRAEAIELCDNKAKTYLRLSRAGIRIPRTICGPKTFEGLGYRDLRFLDGAVETLGLPMVIKEVYGSFGQQVYLAHTKGEAADIISGLGFKEFVMQEYVSVSAGRDVRINMVGGEVVASVLRYNPNDFRSNISNGGAMSPYIPSDRQVKLATEAFRALGLDFGAVDMLFDDNDEPIICEVNSNPHFKSTLDCTGVNLADHIMEHIKATLL